MEVLFLSMGIVRIWYLEPQQTYCYPEKKTDTKVLNKDYQSEKNEKTLSPWQVYWIARINQPNSSILWQETIPFSFI